MLRKQLCDIYSVLLRVRVQLRFGDLCRAPLQLLRLEWRGYHVDCDWVARSHDDWDEDLPLSVDDDRVSLQALEDAIVVRDLLFYTFGDLQTATFRVYRHSTEPAELIITGTVTRPEPRRWDIPSLVMRAKLCGFHFRLDQGKLLTLPRS
jgi:hypothetical protein